MHDLLDFLCRSGAGDFVVASTAVVAAAGNYTQRDEEEDENDGDPD